MEASAKIGKLWDNVGNKIMCTVWNTVSYIKHTKIIQNWLYKTQLLSILPALLQKLTTQWDCNCIYLYLFASVNKDLSL